MTQPFSNNATLPLELQRRIDSACRQFETDWKALQRPRIETYLKGLPPSDRSPTLRELLRLDLEYSRALGDRPNVDAYLARFPEDIADVTAVFEEKERSWSASQPSAAESSAARFTVIKEHDRGGLGIVSLARDKELDRKVALKEIQPRWSRDESMRSRFLMEAQVTGKLEHPAIVPVYGLGSYPDGRPYYVMRFIRGQSLRDAIAAFHGLETSKKKPKHDNLPSSASDVTPHEPRPDAPTDPSTGVSAADVGSDGTPAASPRPAAGSAGKRKGQPAWNLALRELLASFIQVCDAIAYAHNRGVLHRDIKPANIMLDKHGVTLVVDWGLAKWIGSDGEAGIDESSLVPSGSSDSNDTEPGTLVGTLPYMSPEQAQARRDVGPASDVYSLGATLFEILTGRPPLDRGLSRVDSIARTVKGEFPRPRELNRTLPRSLEAICLKAMALKPEDRYASAQALAEDVKRWLADEVATAHRESMGERVRRFVRRHPGWTAAALTTLLFVAPLLSLLELSRRTEIANAKLVEALAEAEVQAQLVKAQVLDTPPSLGPAEQPLPGRPVRFSEQEEANRRQMLDALITSGQTELAIEADGPESLGDRLIPLFPARDVAADARSQSLLSYVAMRRSPLRKDGVIVLQPLGAFNASQRQILKEAKDFLKIFFNRDVSVLGDQPIGRPPASRTRTDPDQWDAAWLIEELRPTAPQSTIAAVGITTSDIYARDLNWAFGINHPDSKHASAVLSLHRMGNPDTEHDLCLLRNCKVLTYLIAQAIWIRDYPQYACILNPTNSRPELDTTHLECCPECEQKIWWACGIDPLKRYAPLIEFSRQHKLEVERTRWEEMQRLIGTGPR